MKIVAAVCLLILSFAAWAQPSDGQPSPAVREQQRQADHARKQHPKSAPAPRSKAAVRTPGDKNTKPPRSKPGEAAIRTP